jgi:hypothetical protein
MRLEEALVGAHLLYKRVPVKFHFNCWLLINSPRWRRFAIDTGTNFPFSATIHIQIRWC